ncbi:outer membrane lipoprotein carrier protein LolA [Candidatus Magnetoovum chiemensis]|nr:outer membrane lipoprotein carrier protein LolA [Candidatus Magnetoovum chiemensis]
MYKKNAILAFVLYFLSFFVFFADTAYCDKGIFPRIMESYNSIKDIKGDFHQKSTLKDLDKTLTFDGVFYIKIPKKMYWRYGGQDLQEVLIIGDKITIYQEEQEQVIRSSFNSETIGQTPIALLSGLMDAQKDYVIFEKGDFARLIPKGGFVNVKYIDIYPSESSFPIKTIIVTDKNMNEIEIKLEDVKINTNVEDTVFEITPPVGVVYVDN